MALDDLSSSWMTGTKCPPAHRGYSRDGTKNLPQIEDALLTDPAGCPVAVRVFDGNGQAANGTTSRVPNDLGSPLPPLLDLPNLAAPVSWWRTVG